MVRFSIAGMLLLAAFAAAAVAQESGTNDAVALSSEIDEHSTAMLSGVARAQWQQPKVVMQVISNIRGETVGEIGAGVGYFTRLLSSAVGPEGKVYAVEFDAKLLSELEKFFTAVQTQNSVILQGTATDPKLPQGELDMVLSVNTWHHLAERAAMREAVQRALKPLGRFVIVDWRLGDIPIAPPEDHRLGRKELIREMLEDGWTLTTDARFLEYQYFLIFMPPAR